MRTDAEGKYRLNGPRKGDRFEVQIELQSVEKFSAAVSGGFASAR